MTKTTYQIDSEIASKLREWFAADRGVTVWQNLEIASGAAREAFTPADVTSAPHWRYGNPTIIQPSDLTVSTFTPIEAFRGRFKAMYFGPWVGKATEAKAERLCAKHGLEKNSWRWEYDEPGYVMVTIGRSVITPFEQEAK